MTGPEHIFEAKDGGLLTAMSDGGAISQLSQGLGVVFEILNKIAQILNKKKWAKTEENVNNITKIMKNFKINQ